jgi:HlyD family secretion protein
MPLSAARSQAEQLKLAMESAKIALQQAQDNARRQRELSKQGLTTREALDRAEAELKTREADMRTQQQQLRTQELRLQQESATLESTRYDLHKVRIESPIDGIVTRRNIEAGETAIIGTMNNPGTVLLTIADMSVIEAEVDVDETDIPNVALGQKAKITIDAMPGKSFTARVTEIGNSPIQAPADCVGPGGELQGRPDGRRRDSIVHPGFTCTAEITTAVARTSSPCRFRQRCVMVVDEKENIVREPQTGRRTAATPAPQRSLPGTRKSWKAYSWSATTRRSSCRSRPASRGTSISRCCRASRKGTRSSSDLSLPCVS